MFTELLDLLVANGMRVIVIRDVPYQGYAVPDCVAQNLDDLSTCDGPRNARLPSDALFTAAEASTNPAISTIDFTDALCDDTTCWDVVGGVIVYYDPGHLTTTFAQTLRPYLEPLVAEALA